MMRSKGQSSSEAASRIHALAGSGPLRLDHVFEIAQALARRVDQHRHIAGLVAIGAHQLVRVGYLLPRKHIAHARIDAAIDDELVGGARLLEMREMRTLHPL